MFMIDSTSHVHDYSALLTTPTSMPDSAVVISQEEMLWHFSAPQCSLRRCVRFDTAVRIHSIHSNHLVFQEEEEDSNARWYSPSDYVAFKRQRQQDVNEILLNVDNRNAYEDVTNHIYQRVCSNSDLTQSDIWDVIQVAGDANRIGLESSLFPAINKRMKLHRAEILYTIRDIEDGDCYMSEDERAEMIASAAQEISAPSRVFSSLLALVRFHFN